MVFGCESGRTARPPGKTCQPDGCQATISPAPSGAGVARRTRAGRKPQECTMSVAQSVVSSSVSLRLVRENRASVATEWTPESATRKPDHFSRDFFAEFERREKARLLPAQTERDLRKARGEAVRGWRFDHATLATATQRHAEATAWAESAFALLANLPKGVLETPVHAATANRSAFTLRDAIGLLFTLPTTSEVRKGGAGE